jgi:hypothetical protein
MNRMSPTASRAIVAIALASANVGCEDGHAAELASRMRLRYTGSLTTTVEQPDAEATCGREYVTFESSGYLTVDRARPSARFEGFGCSIELTSPSGGEFSGSAQRCLPSGVVNFEGLGLQRVDTESLSVNLNDDKISWQARAWRDLPSGRVSYCFTLMGSVEQR